MRRTAMLAALCLVMANIASAQSGLDGVVGSDGSGGPFEFRGFTAHTLGSFARAAHVPIGIELAPDTGLQGGLPPITLTGRTVRDAVALMVAADPRYTWRDDAGVIVFELARPYEGNPLDHAAPAIRLDETNSRLSLALVAALLGAPASTVIHLGDTKSFRLDAPAGTVRSLLNAIVRAHGELVWILERPRRKDPLFPYVLSFMSGPHGYGLGLTGQPGVVTDLATFGVRHADAAWILDATVGPKEDGRPLELAGAWPSAVSDLARTLRAPFGFQSGAEPRRPNEMPPFTATGRPVREVLEILAVRDPRYAWRFLDGAIVVRPTSAWADPNDPLFALVPDVDVQDGSMTDAVRKVLTALGGDVTALTFPDGRNVSFLAVHPTALDLLNALARAHGSLVWTYADADAKEIDATGRKHRLTLGVSGVGYGYLVR
jgi:hypothetical protein